MLQCLPVVQRHNFVKEHTNRIIDQNDAAPSGAYNAAQQDEGVFNAGDYQPDPRQPLNPVISQSAQKRSGLLLSLGSAILAGLCLSLSWVRVP